jgi:hypothetical protein
MFSSAFVPYHRTDCIASCTKGRWLDHISSMQSSILCFLLSMPAPSADSVISLWSIHPFLLVCSCCFIVVKTFYRGITGYYELMLSLEFCANGVDTALSGLCSASFLSGFPADRPIIAHTRPRGEPEQTAELFSLFPVDEPIEAQSPPKQNPGWNTVSTTAAIIIIGPSKIMKTSSLFANAPPKPDSSSATR